MMSNDVKNFDILTISLNILHNYFNNSINYSQICIYTKRMIVSRDLKFCWIQI